MVPLISCQNLSKSISGRDLFKRLSFGIFPGDRIGLIGPNGAGKSTLLKMLAGLESPDEGSIALTKQVKIGYIPQETSFSNTPILSLFTSNKEDDETLGEQQLAATILLTQMGFQDLTLSAQTLSGGWQKRLALALALFQKPDLLLIDEPTNHLDIEGVLWLENFLAKSPCSLLLVSHDRFFLENTTNQTMELSSQYPKGYINFKGPYSVFIEQKSLFLEGQKQQEASLSSKVRREVEWLKQNPKARTTKSQSRIQEAGRLIDSLDALQKRNQVHTSFLSFQPPSKQSIKLLTATQLGFRIGERSLFANVNFTLHPKMCLGVVGANGSGKSSLLKILSGSLSPTQGTVKTAEGVRIVYFDQQRTELDPSLTLRRALAPNSDTVIYRGQSIHVNSWCQRFLFSPSRLDLSIQWLSGGERARVYLARFMLEQADILLLDEPTNDLDLATLELLEQSLEEFTGAIVLVSHDRYLLSRLSTHILGLGSGSDSTLFADYNQWESHFAEVKRDKIKSSAPPSPKPSSTPSASPKKKGLSYAEQKELEGMEKSILTCEQEIASVENKILEIQAKGQMQELPSTYSILHTLHNRLETLYSRWEDLENKKQN